MIPLFILCERDAGVFSLIQQVIANLPRALNQPAIPIVYFGKNCCYWVPTGYQDKDNVWEYYFEPLLESYSSKLIPEEVKNFTENAMGDGSKTGVEFDHKFFITNNFGDHTGLRNDCLVIPYEWKDPDLWLRKVASRLIKIFIRPRQYLLDRVNAFADHHFKDYPIIGVHIRGTDAVSDAEPRLFRKNSLQIEKYLKRIQIEKEKVPSAKIFVATDSSLSLKAIKQVYGAEVINSSKILHDGGPPAGKGPTGALMPAYITSNPRIAAENGAEAIVDYLLLKQCDTLIHNGSSLARTVLLSKPELVHYNTHRKTLFTALQSISITPSSLFRCWQKLDAYILRKKKINFEKWIDYMEKIDNTQMANKSTGKKL